MKRWTKRIEENWELILILILAAVLRLIVIVQKGPLLSINSDDLGYVSSALHLLESGMLTYHGLTDVPTVHLMPGQPFLLAFIFLVTGFLSTTGQWLIAKILFITLGVINVYLVYRISRELLPRVTAWIPALSLAVYLPQIVVDNLLLTETPFLFFFLLLVLYSIRLANDPSNWTYFYIVIFSYLFALMFKATIALYPVLLLFYFVLKKYPFRQALHQFGVAVIALLLVLGPWWVRNYIQFNEFIPLTAGSGNPLLLGTFQGEGGEDYFEGVYSETVEAINKSHPELARKPHLMMEKQKEVAQERMKMMYEKDRDQFLHNYVVHKTKRQYTTQFYWIEVFNISGYSLNTFYYRWIRLTLIATLIAFVFRKKYRPEVVLLASVILMNTVLNSYYFAYDRYSMPFMFIWFIGAAMGITVLLQGMAKSVRFVTQRKGKKG